MTGRNRRTDDENVADSGDHADDQRHPDGQHVTETARDAEGDQHH